MTAHRNPFECPRDGRHCEEMECSFGCARPLPLNRYLFIAETEDGESGDLIVDAPDRDTANVLYLAEIEELEWDVKTVRFVYILPPISEKPIAHTWGNSIKEA